MASAPLVAPVGEVIVMAASTTMSIAEKLLVTGLVIVTGSVGLVLSSTWFYFDLAGLIQRVW
ncbi:MAG TPA: hypothetical protein VNT52_13280 [Acidimicrobiales bacterium]|nr:hypothetical protein [Acidimicrobiales bacterium]